MMVKHAPVDICIRKFGVILAPEQVASTTQKSETDNKEKCLLLSRSWLVPPSSPSPLTWSCRLPRSPTLRPPPPRMSSEFTYTEPLTVIVKLSKRLDFFKKESGVSDPYPVPDPGFWWPEIGKKLPMKKNYIFLIKSCNYF